MFEPNRHQVAGTVAHRRFDQAFVYVLPERDDRHFRIEAVFLPDHFANRIGIMIAIEDDQLDRLPFECIAELVRALYPVAARGVAGVPQRAIDRRGIVLVPG